MKLKRKKNKVTGSCVAAIFAVNLITSPLSVWAVGEQPNLSNNAQTLYEGTLTENSARFSLPSYKRLIGNYDISPVTEFKSVGLNESDTVEYPSSYDMRSDGLVASVKNQGSHGTCWAHSSASCAETDLIKYNPSINLSELHTAYYAWSGNEQMEYTGTTDNIDSLLDNGGSCFVVTNLWAQWLGPVLEDTLTYTDTNFVNNSDLVEKYKSMSEYHLENAYLFDFSSDNSDREQVNSLIKSYISGGQSVDACFYSGSEYYSNGDTYTSCNTDKSPQDANHSITIVGWDDTFSASNFKSAYKPENDGAWLVKNSWGANWGVNGYFWISYEDTSLCEFSVFELGANDNYDTNYQHDTFIPSQNMSSSDNENEPSYMANIFTSEDDQLIEAVSTYFVAPNTEYEITVYTGLSDVNNPSSGIASSVTTGVSEITGYITLTLDESVYVESNENFAVSVKLYCPDDDYVIPIETCLAFVNNEDGTIWETGGLITYEQIKEYTSSGQSFYSADGNNWTDVTESDYVYSDAEKEALVEYITETYGEEKGAEYAAEAENADLTVTMGNISLKAFGSSDNKVKFSHNDSNVPLDEALELSSSNGETVYYSIDGGDFTEYTVPIEISSYCEITATVDNINFYKKNYKPAKAEFGNICYSTGSTPIEAERVDESNYTINLTPTVKSLRFMPVSQADITLNGVEINSYEYSSFYGIEYGENTFTFTLTQENRLDNVVTVTVNRAPVEIDTASETINIADENLIVTAPDGTILTDNDSISDYAGQTLSAVLDDDLFEVNIPDRAVLPEMEIDYYNETLNFLPNEIVDDTVYALDSTINDYNYAPASLRCIDGQYITSGMTTCQAFRIRPSETITLKVLASDEHLSSIPITYEIPDAPAAPVNMLKFVYDGKSTITFEYGEGIEYAIRENVEPITYDSLVAKGLELGYSSGEEYIYQLAIANSIYSENYEDLLIDYLNLQQSSFNWDTLTSINVSEFEDIVDVGIRYWADDNKFASYPESVSFSLKDNKLTYSVGDVDGNGIIDAIDASITLTFYAEKSTGAETDLSPDEELRADFNGSGTVDAIDASEILTYYAMISTGG